MIKAQYVLKRLLMLFPTVLGVSIVVFLLVHLTPGDPAVLILGAENATPEQVASVRHQLGLDQPLPVQYVQFLGRMLRGDLGRSFTTDQPVAELILGRMGATMELTILATLLALLVAVPMGVITAVRRNSALDHVVSVGSTLGVSMPSFWMGLLLILVLSYYTRILPASGRTEGLITAMAGGLPGLVDAFKHILMPAVTLAAGAAALITRLTRSGMLEVLSQDYVRTARAKGLRERRVIYRHALKNALMSVITIVGMEIGALMGGAVIVETVFAWPGVGRLAVQMILQRDYPAVQGIVLAMALVFTLVNLVVDLIYALVDPRVQLS